MRKLSLKIIEIPDNAVAGETQDAGELEDVGAETASEFPNEASGFRLGQLLKIPLLESSITVVRHRTRHGLISKGSATFFLAHLSDFRGFLLKKFKGSRGSEKTFNEFDLYL